MEEEFIPIDVFPQEEEDEFWAEIEESFKEECHI